MSWLRHCHLRLPYAPARGDNSLWSVAPPFSLPLFTASLNQRPALNRLQIKSHGPARHTAKRRPKKSHSHVAHSITQASLWPKESHNQAIHLSMHAQTHVAMFVKRILLACMDRRICIMLGLFGIPLFFSFCRRPCTLSDRCRLRLLGLPCSHC